MPIALLLLLNYKVLKIYSYDNSLKSGHQNVKSIVCKVQLQTIGFFHYCVTSKFTIKKDSRLLFVACGADQQINVEESV